MIANQDGDFGRAKVFDPARVHELRDARCTRGQRQRKVNTLAVYAGPRGHGIRAFERLCKSVQGSSGAPLVLP